MSEDPKLLPCPVCGKPAEYFSRWRYVGSGPRDLIYNYASCPGTPPCLCSISVKDIEAVAKDWNRKASK